MKGSRIHGIVRELRNENIDVINFTTNTQLYISRALSPAKINTIKILEEEKRAEVYLKPNEVSLAIGKGGLNIKLASQLTGYEIDVFRETDMDEEDVNLEEMVARVDIVLDGMDSLSLRMLVNRVCCEKRKIFIHGGIRGTKGVVSSIVPKEGPCLRCIYGDRDFDVPGVSVLGPVPGIVASIQSLEAVNHLGGLGLALKGRLLMFEGRTMTFSYRNVGRTNGCEDCADEKKVI